ncbi:zinc ABC transporter substrate-binding protein [Halodurantibacterium flavum]|uniref:High-affinity zinc uptake system protein ZnuA n=1 Tax=Halodurantibacterium flavum TaxID=1382802 RepID=A0ABW4S5R3_9RHOB
MRYTITAATASAALFAGTAQAEVPQVITDVPPVHSLVAQVMGDLGTPDILLDQGGDPHSFQLRPSQAAALSRADILFWIGPELTPWLDRAVEGVGLRGEAIALLHAEGVHRQDYGDDHGHDHGDHGHGHDDHGHDEDHDHSAGHDHDHADDHGHDHARDDHGHSHHGHDHEHHDHSHDGLDPHAWLDPANARVWLDLIAAELAGHDPENADIYLANAEAAKARVDAAEAEVQSVLSPVGDAPIYVFHDAYGYFAGHFGLNIAGTVALGDAATPGAARLSGLRDDIAGGSGVCIFPEAQHSDAQITQLAASDEIRLGGALDPEGTTLDYGPGLYEALLLSLATTIADCVTE